MELQRAIATASIAPQLLADVLQQRDGTVSLGCTAKRRQHYTPTRRQVRQWGDD
jgi:hypothetical protein